MIEQIYRPAFSKVRPLEYLPEERKTKKLKKSQIQFAGNSALKKLAGKPNSTSGRSRIISFPAHDSIPSWSVAFEYSKKAIFKLSA